MALSYATYSGNGSTTNFSVPFGYVAQADVKVYVDGALKTVTTDYTWFNSTTIQFLVAPAGGTTVRIQRTTESASRLVDFQSAGNLTEADLDLNSDQVFYLSQEAIDNFNDLTLNLTAAGTWDAEMYHIVNLADPINPQDAVTKNWAETSADSSLALALLAQAAAEDAQAYAEEWAIKAEDSPVSVAAGGDASTTFSALHWAAKAEASAASLVMPNPITALQFVRGNATGTAWEQFNLLGTTNAWTENQTFQHSGGQTLLYLTSGSAGGDASINGAITYSFGGTPQAIFGSVPSDANRTFTVSVYDGVYNEALSIHESSKKLALTNTNLVWNGTAVSLAGHGHSISDITGDGALTLTGTFTAQGLAYSDGAHSFRGTGTPTGAGIELHYAAGEGTIQSYNRSGPAYTNITLRGANVDLISNTSVIRAGGSNIVTEGRANTFTAAAVFSSSATFNLGTDFNAGASFSGGLTLDNATTNTVRGHNSDTSVTVLTGGGAWDTARGAWISVYGVSHATGAGLLQLASASNKDIVIDLNGTGNKIRGSAIKDEDTMASNSDGHLCTQQSIKAYADTKVKRSTSGLLTLTTGSRVAFAHGLGVMPEMCTVLLQCAVAEHGYSVGDRIKAPDNVSVALSSSNADVAYTGTISIYTKTSTAAVSATPSSWKAVVTVAV